MCSASLGNLLIKTFHCFRSEPVLELVVEDEFMEDDDDDDEDDDRLDDQVDVTGPLSTSIAPTPALPRDRNIRLLGGGEELMSLRVCGKSPTS